jgi:signal peptidase II
MKRRSILSYLFWAILFFAVDRIAKILALASLSTTKEMNIFQGLRLNVIWNRGISWGILTSLDGFLYYLLIASIVCLIFLFLYYAVREFQRGGDILCEVMIIMGAVSNLYDRLVYGAVVDFIEIYVGAWSWPIFNIADAFIVIGVFGIIIRSIRDGYSRTDIQV